MKRRWLWILSGLIVAGVAIGVVVTRAHSAEDERALQEQIRLARAEGLPTNWREYAATIKTAAPAENAASLYRQLRGKFAKGDPVQLNAELLFQPGGKSRPAAGAFLEKNKEALDLVDKATGLPRCWFDRDWSQASAVLLPEYGYMKGAARIVSVRASFKACQGDPNSALGDVERLFAMARHVREEPSIISHVTGMAIYSMGLRDLAYWTFLFRDEPRYRLALGRAIDDMPRPDLKAETSDNLFMVLDLVDSSLTPAGRRHLGVREDDVPAFAKLVPRFANQARARAAVVEAERDYRLAMGYKTAQRKTRADSAREKLDSALQSFPVAASLYEALFGTEDPAVVRMQMFESSRLEWIAVWRALKNPSIPRSIKTSDLLSPFDGKPLTYSFDGKQIVVTVSGGSGETKPTPLKIPPDRVPGKSSKP